MAEQATEEDQHPNPVLLNGLRVSEATGADIEHLRLVPAVGIIDDHLQRLRPFPRLWPPAFLDHPGEVRRALHQL